MNRPQSRSNPRAIPKRPAELLPSVFPNEDLGGSYSISGEGRRLQEHLRSPRGGSDDRAMPAVVAPDGEYQNLELSDRSSSSQGIRQSSNFVPFFTLIEDSNTGEHHHPSVHYIFSDDDPDVVTDVLVHTLSHQDLQERQSRDRYLILDLAPDGQNVASAKSLNPDWQILGTQISTAPTFGNDVIANNEDEGLMLKVEGVEAGGNDVLKSEQQWGNAMLASGGDAWAAMNRLAENFQKQLELLKRLRDAERTAAGGDEQPELG